MINRRLWILFIPVLLISCSYKARISQYSLPVNISLRETNRYYLLMPDCYDMDEAMALYPGGLVSPDSYIPLAADLAAQLNLAVFIQKMPFDLAVFGSDRVGELLGEFDYIDRWYFAGHSLGGVMACSWIHDNPDIFDGLILLASYPAGKKSLKDSDIAVLSIRGSEDGLVDSVKIGETGLFLPDHTLFEEIKGGNHAQFGSYGSQRKDGIPLISEEEQRAETVRLIGDFLELINRRRVY